MKKTKELVLISTYVALSIVLDVFKSFLPFLNMPSGGSINIALIPIVFCSFHLGVKDGMITGLLWFVLSSMLGLNKYFVSFGQIILDYIIPSIVIGASAIAYKHKDINEIEFGILFTMLIRTLSLCISGAIYWFEEGMARGSKEAWLFSVSYNVPYSFATLIMLLIIIPVLLKTFGNNLYNN